MGHEEHLQTLGVQITDLWQRVVVAEENLKSLMLPKRIEFMLEAGSQKPTRGYKGDAGWDLYTNEELVVFEKMAVNVKTGVSVAMPLGMWGRIASRSSTHRTYGLQVIEGIIDNGYRGELFVQVVNNSGRPVRVEKGARLAQFIPHAVIDLSWVGVNELQQSDRGEKGFGSTGR